MLNKITKGILESYLACKFKGYLKMSGEHGSRSDYEEFQLALQTELWAKAIARLHGRTQGATSLQGKVLTRTSLAEGYPLVLEAILEDATFSLACDGLRRVEGESRLGDFHYAPVLFWEGEKIRQDQRELLAVFGLILAEFQGTVPDHGIIYYGKEAKATKVRLVLHLRRARRLLEDIKRDRAEGTGPRLTLNRHCPVCEFQQRCRAQAVTDNDLSLLQGLSEPEVKRLNHKGIFTVTQLSYTFRPRRKNKRARCQARPHSFPLQALAIRENKVYVQGPLKVPAPPTCIFLDIEGIPGRDLHYLVGIVVVENGKETHHSFWADRDADQVAMVSRLLEHLRQYPEYVLFHFGSYEARALRRIKCQMSRDQQQQIDQVLGRAVNVLSLIHAQVYFSTYSNNLKAIGRCLGCQWSEAAASGLQSLVWRMQWEKAQDESLKRKLLQYNTEDCLALKSLVDFLARVANKGTQDSSGNSSTPPIAPVEELQPAVDHRHRFGAKEAAFPGFEYLNRCAYFDYQRQRVFVRTNRTFRAINKRSQKKCRLSRKVNKVMELTYQRCPVCHSRKIHPLSRVTQTLIDMKFFSAGVKKWVIQYVSWHYWCPKCSTSFLPEEFPQVTTKYGRGLVSWCVYQNVACGQNMLQVRKVLSEVFQLPLGPQQFYRFKTSVADYFRPAYANILAEILKGHLIHADETEVDLRGRKGYVWVLTNMEWVYFFYRDSREADFLREMLKPFTGVLVSDFFTRYDALPCLQQKCLIHLLRDLNEDVFRNPFDQELAQLAQGFAALLRKVIKTVDRHGLQSRYLGRHREEVEAFFDAACAGEVQSDLARAYQKRFDKYRAKLFTFLGQDGVPWNNNNAEHAIHCFARYRTFADGRFTEPSIQDYLVILSLYQSCEYQGINFLQYLRTTNVGSSAFFGSGARRNRCRKADPTNCESSSSDGEQPRTDVPQGKAET